MFKTPWDKTDQELSQELAKGTNSEIQKQTIFLMEILKKIGEAIQENKSVTVENIVRQVMGEVAISRPDWIEELKQDTKPIEKRLDYIASAVIRKEVVREMAIKRPEWIKELIPKDIKFPEAKDFSKPTIDILEKVLEAINDKEITEKVEITNALEIKEPKWFKFPDIDKSIVALAKFIKGYFDKTIIQTEIKNKELKVKVVNPVTEVTVLNPQKEVVAKGVVDALKLIQAQLIGLGNTGSSGAGSSATTTNALDEYSISNIDDNGYFGFIKADGSWYIMFNDTDGSWKYFKGASGYDTAITGGWAARASHVYDYYFNIF